uniref:Integrase n=1 Tax=Siphoviridae sp. ctgBD49 TaxID=2826420 RepID=A0A8S5QQJ1_9CAUD|nr:MAG TPA: Integrase [Siphoviridae sp. ctgBD49]
MGKGLGEAIGEWLINYKKDSVKILTYDRLCTSHDMMLRYKIASIRPEKLTSLDIQQYIRMLVDRGYSMSTIKKQYALLVGYLKFALSQGIIQRPVYLDVKLPAKSIVKKQPRDVETYSEEEQKSLMAVFSKLDDIAYGAAILMMETGLRVGEVLALQWNDIIWKRKAIRIRKTMVLTLDREWLVQPEPKSESSNRIVPLSDEAYKTLEALEWKRPERSFIFYDQRVLDYPMTYDQLRWRLKKACRKAGVEYRGDHIFRHTFASNCYHKGCDVKILSKMLGHADVGITYNVYIHLFEDSLEEMRSVIDKLA